MKQNQSESQIEPSGDPNMTLAWFQDMVRQGRLAWRLFWDQRVPSWSKVIPPAVLTYVISPIDIISDIPPMGLNQLDDIAILLLGIKLFIEIAPPDVVREHLLDLGVHIQEWRVEEEEGESPVVIEGEYQLKEPGTPEDDAEST